MDFKTSRVVLIGAGQAGASLAAKLRALGHIGPLTLIGDEPAPPYQRPPLSKSYLKGEMPVERLFLRPLSFYEQQNIDLITDVEVCGIDRAKKSIACSDGREIQYDRLALTTGSTARKLPASVGGALEGVFSMRTLADADALAQQMQPGARALIVGGGYIGLEAAAVFSAARMTVTVLEREPRILARVAAPETADYFRDLHRSHGVAIREGASLERLEGENGTVRRGHLEDGSEILAEVVLVGIGVEPAVSLAQACGLEIDNGVRVDGGGRTSDPDIFAAGDCASFPYQGKRIRLESVPNAIDQGEAVAASILGDATEYVAQPWFWSDQYDVKLQIAGLNEGYDQIIVRPGARPGSQSVWYWRDGRLIATDAMNDPRAYMTAKRWIEAGQSPDPNRLVDASSDLKTLV